MTNNIIVTETFYKGNINAYIYNLKEIGEESLKFLTDISKTIFIPPTVINTQGPSTSFLVPSK